MRVLLLDLDTLRADHLGCYGYHRNTSPHLDAVAAQGVRFENCYCSDAPCLPARAALISGRFGIHTGVVGHGGTAADMRPEGASRDFRDRLAEESLWMLCRQAGLRTVSISPFAERHSAWWFCAGLLEMHNTGGCGMESAEEITPTALRWIRDNARSDNWFLHVNYWDPHTPYRAPAEFANPFERDPLPDWLTPEVLARHLEAVGPHTAREISMYDDRTNLRYPRQPGEIRDMAGLRRMVDGYDCGIRCMDDHIGQLFEALRREGVFDDLVIIATSDHGENLGELGIYGEHATADHPTCRIPMIVRFPGGMAGHADRGLHYSLDLAPTLADLLGRDRKPAWDGLSCAPAVREGRDCGREFLVELYEEWKPRDTRRVSIRLFDSVLGYLAHGGRSICHMERNCRQYFVVEHNGDVYPCDFFVESDLKLGNVRRDSWERLWNSQRYQDFGARKTRWPRACAECAVLEFCAGDCLKHRPQGSPQVVSWLCEGWKRFYARALPDFRELAAELRDAAASRGGL